MSDKFNKVSDSFVCQYCLSKSPLDKIQFRSSNLKIKNKPDKKKNAFWNNLTGGKGQFMAPQAFTPRIRDLGLQTILNRAGHLVPVAYVDEGLICSDKRLCPICHNDLPENVGFVNTANIVIIGDNSFDTLIFVKNLFHSLLEENNIVDTDFYICNQREWQEANKDAAAKNVLYLYGKCLLCSSKKKINLEVTITYFPLGLDEINHISDAQLLKFLMNSDGLIFVTNCNNIFFESDAFNESTLEKYLFKIKEVMGMRAHDSSAHPVSVVFSNSQMLQENNINVSNTDNLYNSDYIIADDMSQNILKNTNNKILQNIKAIFPNSKFSIVPDDLIHCENNYSIYQNSLNWIFDNNNYIKKKLEKRGLK